MDINIKLLNEFAKIPIRGSAQAAGYDLYAATGYDIEIPPHDTVMVDTGVAIEIPEGVVDKKSYMLSPFFLL